jgi:hypothetical protein
VAKYRDSIDDVKFLLFQIDKVALTLLINRVTTMQDVTVV